MVNTACFDCQDFSLHAADAHVLKRVALLLLPNRENAISISGYCCGLDVFIHADGISVNEHTNSSMLMRTARSHAAAVHASACTLQQGLCWMKNWPFSPLEP